MPASARKHKPLRPPGQRVAKRNARKKRLIKYSFAPRPKAHPRRGNPRSSLYRTPPRPSGSHRRPAGTISRRPPSARRATAPERVQVPFSLDRARPVSLLARQKRNGGCIPAGQAPCGSRIPVAAGRRPKFPRAVCNLPYTLQGRPYHRAAEGGGPYGCTERIYPRASLRPSR